MPIVRLIEDFMPTSGNWKGALNRRQTKRQEDNLGKDHPKEDKSIEDAIQKFWKAVPKLATVTDAKNAAQPVQLALKDYQITLKSDGPRASKETAYILEKVENFISVCDSLLETREQDSKGRDAFVFASASARFLSETHATNLRGVVAAEKLKEEEEKKKTSSQGGTTAKKDEGKPKTPPQSPPGGVSPEDLKDEVRMLSAAIADIRRYCVGAERAAADQAQPDVSKAVQVYLLQLEGNMPHEQAIESQGGLQEFLTTLDQWWTRVRPTIPY